MATRDNAFALYHAKQALIIWLVGMVGGFIAGMVTIILGFICIGYVLGPLIGLAVFGISVWLSVAGIINATSGICQPVPLFGEMANDLFKGVTPKT
jgi:uncharacterized membrane protein